MARQEFTGGWATAKLAAGINNSATSFAVQAGQGTGAPAGTNPFVITIGRGTATEEKVLCSARTSDTFTVSQRGYDNTTAVAHAAGETVDHTLAAVVVDAHDAHVYDTSRDDHTQYMKTTGTRHDLTARHAVGAVVPAGLVGDIVASAPGDTASAGATTKAADAAHRHAREAKGASGDIAASAVGDTVAAGSTGKVADAAHRHAREAFGSPVAVGAANADGTATTVAHSDHVHQSGPANGDTAWLNATETRGANTYGDCGTPGPTKTVTLAAGQKALVILSAHCFNPAPDYSNLSFAVSGAQTLAAPAIAGFEPGHNSASDIEVEKAAVFTAAGAGSYTFTAKYKATSGTSTFYFRAITVIPL